MALLGVSLDAQAVALGAVTVRSSLGEPLRAEIEVPQISSEEAANFQAAVASPQAFRAAGVEFTPALNGARVTLHRRANGQAYLRLVSDRPITEPFLGVVIEANWANGRIVRDYTMLVDPPGRSAPPSVTVTESRVAPPAPGAAPAVVRAPATEATAATRRPVAQPAEAQRPARRAAAAPTPTAPSGDGAQITVQRGDTAYGIVSSRAIDGVSLDQMLVALLQANPKAFINGNVNLMRAGAVLNMPSAEQANAVSRQAARRAVVAQARDFNSYRRGLAQNVRGSTQTAASSRSASGGVQAQVQESSAPAPKQDRLTLSRGGSASGAEAAAAQSRQAKEQADRVAELNKNISDLAKLQSASGANAAGTPGLTVPTGSVAGAASAPSPTAAAKPAVAAASAAAGATVVASAAAPAITPASAASAAATGAAALAAAPAADAAASAASAAVAAASGPATASASIASAPVIVPAPLPKPAPAPAPLPEPSFLESLTENPLALYGGAGLLALLAGLGIYRSRQRKKQVAPLDSSFIESRLQPDSFFGASGGQRVNTRESTGTGNSSMAYSPSQLDAAGDVDPVAEADVYLAYGRDMQAEEILKEAMRTHPGRVAVHRKLAEIYAKRRDARALESVAVEAHEATRGDGPDWLAITSLGSELDPENPLYKPGGMPAAKATAPATARHSFGADTEPQTAQMQEKRRSGAVPLDSTLGLDTAPVRNGHPPSAPAAAVVAAAGAAVVPPSRPVDLDLGLGNAPLRNASAPKPAPSPVGGPVDLDLDFAPPSELGPASRPAVSPVKAAKPVAASASGMIDFDMAALTLNPDSRSDGEIKTEQLPDADDDPIGTKLALAQEFHAIGDTEGARSLVKEVIAEASGSVKARAERFLAELS